VAFRTYRVMSGVSRRYDSYAVNTGLALGGPLLLLISRGIGGYRLNEKPILAGRGQEGQCSVLVFGTTEVSPVFNHSLGNYEFVVEGGSRT